MSDGALENSTFFSTMPSKQVKVGSLKEVSTQFQELSKILGALRAVYASSRVITFAVKTFRTPCADFSGILEEGLEIPGKEIQVTLVYFRLLVLRCTFVFSFFISHE